MQQVGPVNWQKLAGITQPVDAAKLFVLDPLAIQAKTDPALASALGTYTVGARVSAGQLGQRIRQGDRPGREEGAVQRRQPEPARGRAGAGA